MQLYAHHFIALAAWSSGTRSTFITLPAPYIAQSAASQAYQPYLAPITLVAPLATPPPIAYTAPTTPSYKLAITPAPVLAPSLTVQQQGCSCISFPFYDFQKRSPTSTATFLPKRKRLPTCSEVKVSTLAVVFFNSLRFYLVSLETYLSYFFSTFFDKNPPRLSNPFDSRPPVNFRPLLICLDAPTSKLSLSFYVFYSSYKLSNSTFLSFFSTFSGFIGYIFSSSRLYFCLLSLRQHFSPRQEQTASEFSLTLMIH